MVTAGDSLMMRMAKVEEALYQTKNRSGQDPLNFPIRLNNKLAALLGVAGGGEWAPTKQSEDVRIELTTQIDAQLSIFNTLMENDLPAFNQLVKDKSIDAIMLKSRKEKTEVSSTSSDNN